MIINNQKIKDIFLLLALVANMLFTSANQSMYTYGSDALMKYYNFNAESFPYLIKMEIFGLALGSLFSGSVVHIYGKRKLVLVGTAIFCLTQICNLFTNSYALLLLLTAISSFAGAMTIVLTSLILVDNYSSDVASGKKILILIIFTIIKLAYPPVMLYSIEAFNWKAVFLLPLFLASIAYILASCSIDPEITKSNTPIVKTTQVLKGYIALLKNFNFMIIIFILIIPPIVSSLTQVATPTLLVDYLGNRLKLYSNFQEIVAIVSFSSLALSFYSVKKNGNDFTCVVGFAVMSFGVMWLLTAVMLNEKLLLTGYLICSVGASLMSGFSIKALTIVSDDLKGVASSFVMLFTYLSIMRTITFTQELHNDTLSKYITSVGLHLIFVFLLMYIYNNKQFLIKQATSKQ